MSAEGVQTLAILGLLLGALPALAMAGARWLLRFLRHPKAEMLLPGRRETAPLPRASESTASVVRPQFGPAPAGSGHASALVSGQAVASAAFALRAVDPRQTPPRPPLVAVSPFRGS
jgi:hypothetical protein